MNIKHIDYTDIRLYDDECGFFREIIIKCIREAIKPGFKNQFTTEEKNVLAKLAEGLELEIDQSIITILAGDTHTKR